MTEKWWGVQRVKTLWRGSGGAEPPGYFPHARLTKRPSCEVRSGGEKDAGAAGALRYLVATKARTVAQRKLRGL